MIHVYEYFDYRKLLKDLYDERKAANAHFSYRFIGQKAGFTSAGFFTKVLNGSCNISVPMALRLAEVFKLKKHEAEYFELLVQFNQAKAQHEKKHFFDRIVMIRKAKVKDVRADQYALFEEWYYLPVRELLSIHLFTGKDYKELARQVVPSITAAQAKKAVEVLESLGLVRQNPYGYYEQADAVLSTGDKWQSVLITDYQRTMLDIAKDSYDHFERKHRDMSTLTLGVSADTFRQVKERLAQARREILEMARNEKKADRVLQVNIQVWPLSRMEEGK